MMTPATPIAPIRPAAPTASWIFSADGYPAWQGLILEHTAERMRGWIGREPMPSCEALLLPRCNAIHMFGVGRPLALLFIDVHGTVLQKVEAHPWSRPRACLRAWGVLEIAGSNVPPGWSPDWRPQRITWSKA